MDNLQSAGKPGGANKDDDSTRLALLVSSLQVEMRKLPDEQKQAYQEALQVNPAIVEKESDPSMFLRVEEDDIKAAAARLAVYWTFRKKIFGPDRAFRSLLDLSGNGALNEADLNCMRSGFLVRLPGTDSAGRKVFFVDDSRFPKNFKQLGPSRIRMNFYYLTSTALEWPSAQTDGLVFLRTVRSMDFDRTSLHKLLTIITTSFPLKIHSVHFCLIPPKGAAKLFKQTMAPVYLSQFDSFLKDLRLHMASTGESLVSKLQACGIHRLPTTIGGDWSYDQHDAWFQRVTAPVKSASNSVLADTSSDTVGSKGGSSSGRSGGVLSEADKARIEERKDRKRKMDAIYAKQRRAREKNEMEKLQATCVDLSRANFCVEKDNARLEKMLADAKEKVQLVEFGMSLASAKRGLQQPMTLHQRMSSPQGFQMVAAMPTPTTVPKLPPRAANAPSTSSNKRQISRNELMMRLLNGERSPEEEVRTPPPSSSIRQSQNQQQVDQAAVLRALLSGSQQRLQQQQQQQQQQQALQSQQPSSDAALASHLLGRMSSNNTALVQRPSQNLPIKNLCVPGDDSKNLANTLARLLAHPSGLAQPSSFLEQPVPQRLHQPPLLLGPSEQNPLAALTDEQLLRLLEFQQASKRQPSVADLLSGRL